VLRRVIPLWALATLQTVGALALAGPLEGPVRGAGPEAQAALETTFVGQLVSVDLAGRRLTLRQTGSQPREIELLVDEPRTRILSHGRGLGLLDLRPGQQVLAVCASGDRGRYQARLVKVGAPRYAVSSEQRGKP
jgi:hypothetical protein